MIHKPKSRAQTKARLKRLHQRHLAKVIQAVDARDRNRCRVCKILICAYDLTRQPHHHHIQFRSRGGKDTVENIVLVCSLCHDRIHNSGVLRVSGESASLVIQQCINNVWYEKEIE